ERTTPGPAEEAERCEPESVGEREHILRPVLDGAARAAVGEADAGPVDAQDAQSECLRRLPEETRLQPRPGDAVEDEHRGTIGIAPLRVAQLPAVGQRDRAVLGRAPAVGPDATAARRRRTRLGSLR